MLQSLIVLGALLVAPLLAQLPPSSTGDVLVSSSLNDRLLRLDFRGVEIAAITVAGVAYPRGIVVAGDGTVYLVSQNTNEVVVLDRSFAVVRRFPTGAVQGPTGAALGPNGNLFVAGFTSSNVGEYQQNGTFVRAFAHNDLRFTNCVAFLPDGSFVAASAGNGRVVHFESTGALRRSFTGFGLSSPMGMAVFSGELFVAGGGSHNLVVFDFAGNALREIRHAELSGPQGVAVTTDGVLVTSSFYTNKVSWFGRDGTHRGTVLPPSSVVPRSVAFLPAIELAAVGAPSVGVPHPIPLSCPFAPGAIYATVLAFSRSPGLPLFDGRVFDLTPDALFNLSLSGSAAFAGFVGTLDASGRALPVLLLPNEPRLRGVTIHAGALTLDPTWPWLFRHVSASVAWTIS